MGVQTALFVVAIVLMANAAITMWTSITLTVSDGIGTLHVGPCAEVKKTGLGLHILINFLGTLLLGASNLCMQCLSSPTRSEVDAQHAQKEWLVIGILSLRNLRKINRRRVWLWFFLGMTSFPIHLMSVTFWDNSGKPLLDMPAYLGSDMQVQFGSLCQSYVSTHVITLFNLKNEF